MAGHLSQLEANVQRDVDLIRARVRRMGELVLHALEDAVGALAGQNRKLAYAVVLRDQRIDALEGHIDRLCQEFLVRHLPVAAQLRFVVSVIKINAELERIGDYAESIARRAIDLASQQPQPAYARIREMAEPAFRMLKQSVEAFLEEDAELARATLEMDREVNAAERRIHADLAHPNKPTADLETIFTLLSIADRIERVADRACNISEDAIYTATGQVMRHLPREDQRVLFLSRENACRTQLAEAIGRTLAPSSLQLASAGTEPAAIDVGVADTMARHGLPAARLRAKSVGEVGPLDGYHVVVTFGPEAEAACARLPFKVIRLDWSATVPPVESVAAGEDPHAAYERTYANVRARVTDLIDALSGAFHDDNEKEEA